MNEQELILACKNEKDANTKERLLLAKQVLLDGQIASRVAESLGHVRSWAYRWLAGLEEEGAEGMHDRQRTGRPPKIPKPKLDSIEKQIAQNPAGWGAKQVTNLIYEESKARCHEVHVYGLLRKWGCTPKVAQKRFANSATQEEKQDFKKTPRKKWPQK